MQEQDPTLAPAPEAVTSTEVLTQLQALEPEAQDAFFNDWLDNTLPGRISTKTKLAAEAAGSGDKDLEEIRVLEAYAQMEDARRYAEREAKGELTPTELATKEALSALFPDKWPFNQQNQETNVEQAPQDVEDHGGQTVTEITTTTPETTPYPGMLSLTTETTMVPETTTTTPETTSEPPVPTVPHFMSPPKTL